LIPESGGSNAVWTLQPGSNYQILDVNIFDRWGSKVFGTGEITSPVSWDGKLNGTILMPGVYVYAITVQYKNGRTERLKGDVTLIR